MKCLLLFISVVVLGHVQAQIHLGPIGDRLTIDCYTCDGHHHGLPGCLDHVHTCHQDEVCKITYGDGHQPTIHCQKKHECMDAIASPLRNCSGGGVEISVHAGPGHHGPADHGPDAGATTCQKCCTDTKCVSDLAGLLSLEAVTSKDLECPGHCQENDLSACMNHPHKCHEGQFCGIQKDGHGVKGECWEDEEDYNWCLEEKRRKGCDNWDGHGHCLMDCCTTNDCVSKLLGLTPATVAPSAAPANTTLWQRLHGNCRDEVDNDGCAALVKSRDVCHDRLALDICPDTCGLCAAANSTVCADTVSDGGCADLKLNKDICNDPMAVFICPQTCNKCDELLNSVITAVLTGTSNSTSAPVTSAPVTSGPMTSAYPTFDCRDLDSMDCGQIGGLCGSSFIQVVCPDKCAQCAGTTMMPATAAPAVVDTTIIMASATPQPDIAVPSTPAPSSAPTSAPVPASSTPSPDGDMTDETPVDNCSDHLNGMSCTELVDVCSSVLALSVCPKHCGLC